MNRGAWQATVHGGYKELNVTEHTHPHTPTLICTHTHTHTNTPSPWEGSLLEMV